MVFSCSSFINDLHYTPLTSQLTYSPRLLASQSSLESLSIYVQLKLYIQSRSIRHRTPTAFSAAISTPAPHFSAAGSIVYNMSLFHSQTPVPGPKPLPPSVASILSRLSHPAPPSATLPPPQPSTGAQLFQRIQQLQAPQAITLNPAYQPSPASSSSLFSPSAPSNLFTPPAQSSAFGGFVSFQPAMYDPLSASRRTATPKEEPDYYPASPGVDEERTLEEFEHFLKLPIEIMGLVVEQCALQDGVCLSLASKHMYALARPILLRRDKEAYSLSRMSRYECRHFLPKTEGHKPCTLKSCRNTAAYFDRHCVACTSCPLHVRLGKGNWSGLSEKTYAYCSSTGRYWVDDGNGSQKMQQTCGKFKLRKKFWKGKCLHGGPRPKKR